MKTRRETQVELNILMGLSKNAGWNLLVKTQFMRLKDLQRDISTADVAKLMCDSKELAQHCEKIMEAKVILSVIEYPERKIVELQKELGEIIEKGGNDD